MAPWCRRLAARQLETSGPRSELGVLEFSRNIFSLWILFIICVSRSELSPSEPLLDVRLACPPDSPGNLFPMCHPFGIPCLLSFSSVLKCRIYHEIISIPFCLPLPFFNPHMLLPGPSTTWTGSSPRLECLEDVLAALHSPRKYLKIKDLLYDPEYWGLVLFRVYHILS